MLFSWWPRKADDLWRDRQSAMQECFCQRIQMPAAYSYISAFSLASWCLPTPLLLMCSPSHLKSPLPLCLFKGNFKLYSTKVTAASVCRTTHENHMHIKIKPASVHHDRAWCAIFFFKLSWLNSILKIWWLKQPNGKVSHWDVWGFKRIGILDVVL